MIGAAICLALKLRECFFVFYFIFYRFAIASMLGDWSGFDVERSISYIVKSQAYDGGFGLAPSAEGHGGSTCACIPRSARNRKICIQLLCWCMFEQILCGRSSAPVWSARIGALAQCTPVAVAMVRVAPGRRLLGTPKQARRHVLFFLDWRHVANAWRYIYRF